MFQSAYQDGDCVEVFSPAGKNPAADWKLSGKVVRMYEKGVKGYVLAVSGGATSKMQLPKAPKSLLGLRQRHLVLQVLTSTSHDKPFSLELGLTDTGGTRRRLVLSSSFRALHCTPLHAQIPLVGLERHRGSWANLTIDLVGLTAVCFKADDFRTLDLLAIGPTCRLRKVFTMKEALDDSSGAGGEDDHRELISAGASGTGRKGGDLLPARLRASKASLSSGRTRKVDHTEVAEDGGDSGAGGEGGGRIAREPPAEWRVAGNWNGRQEKPAPAWSLFDDSSPDDGFRAVTPEAKHAYSIQAEDVLPVSITTRCGTSGSHATASIADHENSGAASELANQGLGGGVRVIAGAPSSSPQPSPEVPANIDVSWLERHKREDGGAVAATSMEARDNRSASSRFRPWSSAAINVSAATAEPLPGAFDPPNTSFAADAVVKHIEDGDKKTRSATRASLFASPLSPREETGAIARRSPLSAGDASRRGKMQRSPMSARVDVLQNLLAPGAMSGEELRPQNDSGKERGKTQVSRTETEALPDGKGGGGDNGSGVAGDADALERLLVRSTINVDTGSSVRGDNGSPITSCASSSFDAIARPANCGPDACVISSSRDDHRDEGGTDRHRTIATKEVSAVPTQVARTHTDVRTDLSALDGGRFPGGQANSLSLAEESGATVETSRKGIRRGNIGESDDREEIEGFSSTYGEGAKGVLESSFFRATSRERGHGENTETPKAVDRSDLEELEPISGEACFLRRGLFA
ncbi:conserved unknown protein [Ectocarpus siliculosus]|uniref:CFA20 domain-containing protein n=1 Tax=Ectocarpus siliculosus TaxID=2880 RepID=D8LS32_ECTSI|nr:conserved unknown protein [Ectocarpus siliculosus]|eukprot:CBN73816.1 conserved unknown protein [Ectocarpus siliculosus]